MGASFVMTGGKGWFNLAAMDQSVLLDYGREAIWICIVIGAPVMLTGLFVGVLVGLFQALTQIQEMTLTFVPKILAIFFMLFIMLPFMGGVLGEFMRSIADQIIGAPNF